jgi:YbgC/YbaW family acyl-CoA thioester hydrolase
MPKPVPPPPPPPGVPTLVREETVGMIDCDPFQIHFAAYFRWVDLGYSMLTEKLGRPALRLLEEGFAAPCVECHINYFTPLRYGDRFTATSWIGETGRTSYFVAHRFEREGELMAQAHTKHVWTRYGPPQEALPLPGWVLDASSAQSSATTST